MKEMTIEKLAVNPNKKLTCDIRKHLINVIEQEFWQQQTIYNQKHQAKQEKITKELRDKSGWTKLKKIVDKKEAELEVAKKNLFSTGFGRSGDVLRQYDARPYGELAVANAEKAEQIIADKTKDSIPAHSLKSKLITRMSLASTTGEALVIMKGLLGNGILPAISEREIRLITE